MQRFFTYFNNDPRPLFNKFDFHSGQYIKLFIAQPEDVETVKDVLDEYDIHYEAATCTIGDICLKVSVTLDTMALLMQGIAPEFWALYSAENELIGEAIDSETFLLAGETFEF